jgi:hypothetical protein
MLALKISDNIKVRRIKSTNPSLLLLNPKSLGHLFYNHMLCNLTGILVTSCLHKGMFHSTGERLRRVRAVAHKGKVWRFPFYSTIPLWESLLGWLVQEQTLKWIFICKWFIKELFWGKLIRYWGKQGKEGKETKHKI